MRRVDHEHVDARVGQHHGALVPVGAHAHGGAHDQPAVGVLRGVRVLLRLDEVLDRDEAAQLAVTVDDRQLLDLVAPQQPECRVGGDTHLRRHQRRLRHHLAHGLAVVHLEPHVAVGDDADERARGVRHRHTGDAEPSAQLVHLREGVVRRTRDRIGHHAGLGTLDDLDGLSLFVDREVPLQHAQTTLPSHGDGHARLGHRVHRRGHHGDVQPHVAGQVGARVHAARDHVRLGGQQQNVVERQAQHRELVRDSTGLLRHGGRTCGHGVIRHEWS